MGGDDDIFHLFVSEVINQNAPPYELRIWANDDANNADLVVFDPSKALRDKLDQLTDRTLTRKLVTIPTQDKLCVEIGQELFYHIIEVPARVHNQFKSSLRRPRLALHLPPSLYRYPWELLHDRDSPDGNFLSLFGSVFRCDRDLPNARYVDVPAVGPPVRFFYLSSTPADRPPLNPPPIPESNEILRFIPIIPGTYENFRSKTRADRTNAENGLILFGHGEVTHDNVGAFIFMQQQQRKLIFKDYVSDPRTSWGVSEALGNAKIRLAVFCACESAWAQAGPDFGNSLVGAHLRGQAKIPFVIGAQTPIDNNAATQMLDSVLGLIHEMPLDLVVSEARKAIRAIFPDAGGRLSALDWWIPVPYTRTSNLWVMEYKISPDIPGTTVPASIPARERTIGPDNPFQFRETMFAVGRALAPLFGVSGDRDDRSG
jgi:hypothetical protein